MAGQKMLFAGRVNDVMDVEAPFASGAGIFRCKILLI